MYGENIILLTKIYFDWKNKPMSRCYLVTGGAGFIGSHVVDKLIDKAKVICVDNFDKFYSVDIKNGNIKNHIQHENYKLYKIDIKDKRALENVFKENEITHIVHLAAKAGVRSSMSDPASYINTNIVGTFNVLQCAKEFNIKNITFASSSSVYGDRQEEMPFAEDAKTSNPISVYAATKLSGEHLCYTYSYLYNIKIICLRFFTVYGPRQRPDLAIYSFTDSIIRGRSIYLFADGTTKRDYTYINDISEGILAAVEYNKSNFEIINLGCGDPIELKLLISSLEQVIGKNANIRKTRRQPGDVNLTFADLSKARDLLNYKPKILLEDGVKKFVHWFRIKNRD